jgi:4-hydroxy-2-oxoheptanedioate aldolase
MRSETEAMLKQKLASGEPAFMASLSFNSPNLVEYLGRLGFDAVMLDCEHTSASFERVEEMARAARAARIAAIVRPEKLDRAMITRYIDCGADGIMVPLVQNAAMAREAVDIVRYARPRTHDRLLIVVMVESLEAVEALPAILAVEGIDVFFVARGDLAKSMGLAGEKTHPDVRPVLDRAFASITAAGASLGAAGDFATVREVIGKGARLVLVSVEGLLAHGFTAYRQRIAAG